MEVVVALLGTILAAFSALLGASGGLLRHFGAEKPLSEALFAKRDAGTWPQEAPRDLKRSPNGPPKLPR